jgi:hypothetical protein
MPTLEELKEGWKTNTPISVPHVYDLKDILAIHRKRSIRQVNRAIQYFWASLTLQIIVYGLLTYVFVRFWNVTDVQWLCMAGVLIHLPFTFVLMRQFRRVAGVSPALHEGEFSLQARIQRQYYSLMTFYRFKRTYEYGLIPLNTALAVYLIFRLYVPGSVLQYPTGAGITYLLSLIACGCAIHLENRRHFQQPLRDLEQILEEFEKYPASNH